ncbi:MAG: fatty acid desaturase [Acidobacteria bacterium]|nr:fatty acid desaturase [Acidobacteriota bacterium]
MLTVGKPLDKTQLKELARIRAGPFLLRLLGYVALAAAAAAAIATTRGVPALAAMAVLGQLFAHGVELQHQTLHHTAFRDKRWNRFTGFLLGLPMLVSFTDYQCSHLRHHRTLGTKNDREFFNDGFERLTTLPAFLAHLAMLRHWRAVAAAIAGALIGRLRPGVKRESARRMRTEYRWMAAIVAAAAAGSLVFHTLLAVKLWLLPLLFAMPTHALIELPEHWDRDHDSLDLARNTRTIRTGAFGFWFTNGNNYHTEHHWLPAVPNDRFPELHRQISDQIETETYPAFFQRFFAELYRNTTSRRASPQMGPGT